MSERVHVPDLATVSRVYVEDGREPEMTVRLPKGARMDALAPGERVMLHTGARFGGPPSIECEGEVVAVALVVRPDWSTLRNPRTERDQGRLL